MKNYNELALEKWNSGKRNKTEIAREVKVCDQIFTAFETIDNYFKGKKTLAHRIIDDNGNPLYLKTLLFSKKKGEYEVLGIDEIEVDEYLAPHTLPFFY